jgi:hypothetical protein
MGFYCSVFYDFWYSGVFLTVFQEFVNSAILDCRGLRSDQKFVLKNRGGYIIEFFIESQEEDRVSGIPIIFHSFFE